MKPKKADIILITFFLAAVAVLYALKTFTAKSGASADVYINNELVISLPLDSDTVYTPPGKNMQIEVKNGKVAVTQSDCPDKICVNTGFIDKGGQTAVCGRERP